MRHHGEVSYVGSEVLFDTSNAVYDPLLPRPRIHCLSLSCIMQDLATQGLIFSNKLAPVLQVPALKPEKHTLCPTCSRQKPSRGKGGPHKRYTIRFSCYRLICVATSATGTLLILGTSSLYGMLLPLLHIIDLKNKSDASAKFIEWVRKQRTTLRAEVATRSVLLGRTTG